MEIKGKIYEIGEIQQVTDTFKKRDVIIEYCESNPQYVEHLKFEMHQQLTAIPDAFKVGDPVTVSFSLRGRPWTNREGNTTYFNSLIAWNIKPDTEVKQKAYIAPPPAPIDLDEEAVDVGGDLPF